MTLETKVEMAALYRLGKTYKEIAESYKLSKSTVRSAIASSGVDTSKRVRLFTAQPNSGGVICRVPADMGLEAGEQYTVDKNKRGDIIIRKAVYDEARV